MQKICSSPNDSAIDQRSSSVIVHFLHHAEAQNREQGVASEFRRRIRDPDLTDQGRKDCRKFAKKVFPYHKNYITTIYCSPMSRAISTATLCLPKLALIEIAFELQTVSDGPNGIGLKKREWLEKFGRKGSSKFAWRVNCDSEIPRDWTAKEDGRWSADKLGWRVSEFMAMLRRCREGSEVVVVGHCSFLEALVPRINIDRHRVQFISYKLVKDGTFEELTPGDLRKMRKERDLIIKDTKEQKLQADGNSHQISSAGDVSQLSQSKKESDGEESKIKAKQADPGGDLVECSLKGVVLVETPRLLDKTEEEVRKTGVEQATKELEWTEKRLEANKRELESINDWETRLSKARKLD